MDILKAVKRNPVSTAFIVGIAGCLAFSSGNVKQNIQVINAVRDVTQENSAKEMQLRASLEASQQQAEIASARYQSGCVMVVAMNNPKFFTTLSEGQPVMDRIRKTPLPIGTIVCDANGNTAKIVSVQGKPVVGELAFTGDRTLVEQAKKRANARYAIPNQ
jgi:hypothetical protein